MRIDDHVTIGKHCTIRAASIGCNVLIGERVILEKGCVIHDNVQIDDDSIVKSFTIIPPFTRMTCNGMLVPLNTNFSSLAKRTAELQYDKFACQLSQ